MIIPKAVFLHYTYNKTQGGQLDSVKQESQRVKGQLVMELRNPEVHQQGEIQGFFSAQQYPQLSQQLNTAVSDTFIADFTLAGYHIKVQHSEGGFSIQLSWKQSPLLTIPNPHQRP